jgi:hypothetical protein
MSLVVRSPFARLIALLFVLTAQTVFADIIPISSDRLVSLQVFGPPGHSNDPECGVSFNCINFDQNRSSSSTQPFNQSLSVAGNGEAQQTSSISPGSIAVRGVTVAANNRTDPFTYVNSVSSFDLHFQVSQPEDWRLAVAMPETGLCPCLTVSFSLVGPGISITFDETEPAIHPIQIDQLVGLVPGSYRLQVATRINAQEESAAMNYDVTFRSVVPEPGSWLLLIISLIVVGAEYRWRIVCSLTAR